MVLMKLRLTKKFILQFISIKRYVLGEHLCIFNMVYTLVFCVWDPSSPELNREVNILWMISLK